MDIKTKLVEEFANEMDEVSKIEVGSDQQKIAVDCALKIADRIIEIEKINQMNSSDEAKRISEEAFREEEIKIDKKDKMTRNVITGVSVVGGLTLTALAALITTNFELKGGMHTTEAGKNSIRSLLKFKF